MNIRDLKFTIKANVPPLPPCPPPRTSSNKANKFYDEKYKSRMEQWRKDFEEWKKFKENNIINNRFEILDL